MMQQVLVKFPWPILSSLGLFIFFTVFVTTVVLVNLKSRSITQRHAAGLPLDDGNLETRHV